MIMHRRCALLAYLSSKLTEHTPTPMHDPCMHACRLALLHLSPSHRAVTKNRLTAYLNTMHQHMHQIANQAQMMGKRGEAWFTQQMKELEPIVDLQAQIILFGVEEPNARRR
jgi:hypothetical protein